MAVACDTICTPDGIHPYTPRVLVNSAQTFHLYSSFQPSLPEHSDLTSCLQFSDHPDYSSTMEASQDEVDMETFQRLSDSYQPDIQVGLSLTLKTFLSV